MLKLEATIEAGDQQKVLLFETEEQVITIGRESKNDFQLPLTTVSRQHCRISLSDNQYFVEDLNSSHGTQLNGQKLNPGEKKLLRNGDTLSITKAKIGVKIVRDTLTREVGEHTEALAKRAVEDILGKLGAAGGKDEVPFLRVMSGPDEGTKFYLRGTTAECVLGRSRESDLLVNDPNASRRHAIVRKDYNGVIIQCLGAKNPTAVNGKDVPRNGVKRLRDRDEVSIGAVRVVFIDPDAELLKSLDGIPGFEDPPEPEDEPVQEAPVEESVVDEPMADESVGGPLMDDASVAGEFEDAPEQSVVEAPVEMAVSAPVDEAPVVSGEKGKFGPEMILVFVVAAVLLVVVGLLVLLLV